MVAPTGSKSGDTINIIVAKVKFDDLQDILQAGTAKAQELNERYSIVARATKLFEQAQEKAVEIDEKYNVSGSKAAGIAMSAFEKAKELNEKYEVVTKVKGAVDRLVAYAVEIDEKYDVRTTAARLVVNGVNTVVSSSLVTPKTLPATVASETNTAVASTE